MKKSIGLITALILVLVLALPCSAAGVSSGGGSAGGGAGGSAGGGAIGGGMGHPSAGLVTVQLSDVTIESGTEDVSVDLRMTRNDGCTSIRFEVVYDEDVLTLESIDDSGVFSGRNHSDKYSSPYILSWENDYARENITSTGTLVTLNFTVDKNAPAGNYPIQIRKYEVLNTDIQNLNCGIVMGFVRIVPSAAKLNVNNYVDAGETATFDISLESPEGVFGTVIVAAYDSDGKMLSLDSYTAFRTMEDISVNITDADHINIMWWDMFDLSPFAECKTITL